jgi:hypothetical protein
MWYSPHVRINPALTIDSATAGIALDLFDEALGELEREEGRR